jgi:hypothetical protein
VVYIEVGIMESWTYLDGVRVEIPQSAIEARDRGWYQAMAFMPAFKDAPLYDEMINWCIDTYDGRLWRSFVNGMWFYRKKDRDWFTLRWGDKFIANPGHI